MSDALLTDLKPDDVLLLFRTPDAQGRRKASRIAWSTIENFVLSRQPTVAGTPGKSAYQLAVAAGFSGTEAQWLASLKGATGPDRIKIAKTLTTNSSGVATITNVPTSASVLIVSPKTDGAIQKSVVRDATTPTTVVVTFRTLHTGVLPTVLSSLFTTPIAVTFDFLAIEPTP